MKAFFVITIPVLALGVLLWTRGEQRATSAVPERAVPEDRSPQKPEDPAPQGFVVLELFTSEGCSSCPPAEALLNKIAADASASGKPVYPLAFHVDYWNRLGWKDRFSDPSYSDRQRSYARVLDLRSIYTPQMIVNGTVQFVGSDRSAATDAVAHALAVPPSSSLDLSILSVTQDSIRVGYTITGKEEPGGMLNVALVESGLETQVKSGENGGRTLHHRNVVRAFVRDSPGKANKGTGKGTVVLPLPGGVDREQSTVIGYVQDQATMSISAAGSVPVSASPAAERR